MLWDVNGLLCLHDAPRPASSMVKVFNSCKSELQDRQIGDRRAMNSLELKVCGPSRFLPSGNELMDLFIDIKSQKLVIAASDRKDFYRQIWTTGSRTLTNTVGPAVPVELVQHTEAYAEYLRKTGSRKRASRLQHGDQLHLGFMHRRGLLVQGQAEEPPDGHLWAAFRSILQGDHAGVEIYSDPSS